MIIQSLLFSFLIVFVTVCIPKKSFSQSTSSGTGIVSPSTQTADVLQGQPDFPDYIVAPREDLNPFGLSTMEGSTDIDYRDSVGTLGTTTKRPSNLEVNRPKEATPEEESAGTISQSPEDSFLEADVVSQSPSLRSRKQGSIYRWTDEDGVLHVTNEIGSVPAKYQEQAIKQSSGQQ